MKKRITYPLACLLSLSLLAACSTNSPESSRQSKETTTQKHYKAATFTTTNQSFSIELDETYQSTVSARFASKHGESDDYLDLTSGTSRIVLSAERHAKEDIALSIDKFHEHMLTLEDTHDGLKDKTLTPDTLAGKDGFSLKEDILQEGEKTFFFLFVYEENGFYKKLASYGSIDQEKAIKAEVEKAIKSWQDLPATPQYSLTQSVTIPFVGVPIMIPSDWNNEPREDGDPHSLDFFSPKKDMYLSIEGNLAGEEEEWLTTESVNDSAKNISPDATITKTTIGAHSGYLIEATIVKDNLWKEQISNFLIIRDKQFISIYFNVPPSQKEAFRPTMEAIIASIQ